MSNDPAKARFFVIQAMRWSGLAMVFFSFSGLWLYIQMWRNRKDRALKPGWLDGALRAAGVLKEGESL